MPHRKRRWSLYVLHRWVGAVVAVLALLLASTGILLNHANALGLDRKPVRMPLLLDSYGIEMPLPDRGYSLGDHWLASVDGSLYWDRAAIGHVGDLLGVAPLAPGWLVLGRDAAVLLDASGQLVESLDLADWPAGAVGISASDDAVILSTTNGDFVSDAELLNWQSAPAAAPRQRLEPKALPAATAAAMRDDARAQALNWERVLLDLHSGRLPGSWGMLLADAAGLALILLALSGLWMFLRHLRRQRRRG